MGSNFLPILDKDIEIFSPADVEDFHQATEARSIEIILMDQSISMRKFGPAPLEAVNAHFRAAKRARDGLEHFCLVVTYNVTPELAIPLTVASNLRKMAKSQFDPRERTLLWKTICRVNEECIRFLEALPEDKRPTICIAIFTDGDDNLSCPPNQEEDFLVKLQHTVPIALDYGIEFFVYSFGQEASEVAMKMNLPHNKEHALTIESSSSGLLYAARRFSRSTTSENRTKT